MENKGVLKKMLAVASEVDVLAKTGSGDGYKYAEESVVKGMVRPLLLKHGLMCLTSITESQHVGNWVSVKTTHQFVDVESGEREFIFGEGKSRNQVNAVGSATTMALKSALMNTFLMGTFDDEEKLEQPKNDLSATEEKLMGELAKVASSTSNAVQAGTVEEKASEPQAVVAVDRRKELLSMLEAMGINPGDHPGKNTVKKLEGLYEKHRPKDPVEEEMKVISDPEPVVEPGFSVPPLPKSGSRSFPDSHVIMKYVLSLPFEVAYDKSRYESLEMFCMRAPDHEVEQALVDSAC